MVFFLTPSGQRMDPERQAFSSSEIAQYSGATIRQIGEWIEKGIVTAGQNPGRGVRREFSIWHLLEASMATYFSVFSHIRILEACLPQLRDWAASQRPETMKTTVPNEFIPLMQDLPAEITMEKIHALISDFRRSLYLNVLHDCVDVNGPQGSPKDPAYIVFYSGYNDRPPSDILNVGPEILLTVPPLYLSVNMSALYCQMAARLITDWG